MNSPGRHQKNSFKVPAMPVMTPLKNEEGFVLVAALMILVILVVVGITATNTSFLEMQIAANDRLYKQSFFQADGGTDVGVNLAYENALCLNSKDGFSKTGTMTIGGNVVNVSKIAGVVVQEDPIVKFALADPVRTPVLPPPANIDAFYYTEENVDYVTKNDNIPHTDMSFQGESDSAPGAFQSMVSGYLGMGYSSAGGGTDVLYTIHSRHMGPSNSQSTISLQWRMSAFLINSASSFDCNY